MHDVKCSKMHLNIDNENVLFVACFGSPAALFMHGVEGGLDFLMPLEGSMVVSNYGDRPWQVISIAHLFVALIMPKGNPEVLLVQF
jgi:hypothetical protein